MSKGGDKFTPFFKSRKKMDYTKGLFWCPFRDIAVNVFHKLAEMLELEVVRNQSLVICADCLVEKSFETIVKAWQFSQTKFETVDMLVTLGMWGPLVIQIGL